MTRTMGDAIHDNVAALAAAGPWDMVAGYVTGSPDILWTTADMAQFPGIPIVTIDQGFTGSPVATADVRDVENGAWTPTAAVNRAGWTAARPTIYCNESTLPSVLAAGWQGDLWLAIVTSQPPSSPPVVAGCTVVAVQYALSVSGAYDVSVVFDPTWPEVTVTTPAPQLQGQIGICTKCAAVFYAGPVYPGNANFCPNNNGAPHVADSRSYSLLYAQ